MKIKKIWLKTAYTYSRFVIGNPRSANCEVIMRIDNVEFFIPINDDYAVRDSCPCSETWKFQGSIPRSCITYTSWLVYKASLERV